MIDEGINENASQLIHRVKKAFSKVQYPGDNNIVNGESWEHNEYKAAFRGKDWRNLTFDLVCPKHCGMSFFSVEALRYFLPGYIILCLKDLDEADVMGDYLVEILTLPKQGDDTRNQEFMSELANDKLDFDNMSQMQQELEWTDEELVNNIKRFHERFSVLNLEQKQTIRAFLEWLTEQEDYFDDEPKIAIERYWKQF